MKTSPTTAAVADASDHHPSQDGNDSPYYEPRPRRADPLDEFGLNDAERQMNRKRSYDLKRFLGMNQAGI